MNIKLYKTATQVNAITKTLTDEISLTGTLKDETDILKPTVLITSTSNLSSYNYMYIPEFNRYYFIELKVLRTNLYEIKGKCDVLFSHKTEILNNTAIIARQEKIYNMYLGDSNFKIYAQKSIQTKEYPYGFTRQGSFVLTTLGGV